MVHRKVGLEWFYFLSLLLGDYPILNIHSNKKAGFLGFPDRGPACIKIMTKSLCTMKVKDGGLGVGLYYVALTVHTFYQP